MIWIVAALVVALVAFGLGLAVLFAWGEPVRRGPVDLTGVRPRKAGRR